MIDRFNWLLSTACLMGIAVAEAIEPAFPGPLHAIIIGMGMGGFVQLRLLARSKLPILALVSELGFAAFAAYLMYAFLVQTNYTTKVHVINALCGLAGMSGGAGIAIIGEKLLGWKIYEVPKNGP